MVPDKVKAELKRFLTAKQVEELSKQLDNYEKRVREAVKQFDIKGRQAKAKGQERLDQFAAQVKKTSTQLEKQLKTFMNQEGKVLNKGLNDLFVYFRGLKQGEPSAPVKKASAKRKAAPKSAARKPRSSSKSVSPSAPAN